MPHFIFIQQISVLNILNMLCNLHFFSKKCRLFHNATLFGFCITHILNTGCAKIKKNSVAERLIEEHRLKEIANEVLRMSFGSSRQDVTGDRRNLNNEEFIGIYSLGNIIRVLK